MAQHGEAPTSLGRYLVGTLGALLGAGSGYLAGHWFATLLWRYADDHFGGLAHFEKDASSFVTTGTVAGLVLGAAMGAIMALALTRRSAATEAGHDGAGRSPRRIFGLVLPALFGWLGVMTVEILTYLHGLDARPIFLHLLGLAAGVVGGSLLGLLLDVYVTGGRRRASDPATPR